MSKVQKLRLLVEQRLTAAAADIFELFERTIAEYQQELCGSTEENQRRQELLEGVFYPHTGENQVRTKARTEHPGCKEEREEDWTRQEGGQSAELMDPEVPVKTEDHEDEPQSFQLHQRQIPAEGKEEPRTSSSTRHTDTGGGLGPKGSDCSEPETGVSDDWKESRERQRSSSPPQNTVRSVKDKKQFSCSVCGKTYRCKHYLKSHMRIHTGEKPFSCADCGKTFCQKGNLKSHLRIHRGEKPFSCFECGQRFGHKSTLNTHMKLHSKEKPFGCSVCNKRFGREKTLNTHMKGHTREKPFSCSVCNKHFEWKSRLESHMKSHTGRKRHHFWTL